MASRRLLALAALASVMIACGGDADPSDGPGGEDAPTEPRLTLDLEGVAMPAGVAADEVEVSLVELDHEATAGTAATRTVAAFQLFPSGLEFPSPVGITIELPASVVPPGESLSLLLVLTSETGDPEVLPVEHMERDQEDGTIRVQTSVTHFSGLTVVSVYGEAEVDIEPPPGDDFALGSNFTVNARIHRPHQEWEDPAVRVTFADGTRGVLPMRRSSDPGPWNTRSWWVVNDGLQGILAMFREGSGVTAVEPVGRAEVTQDHAATATSTPWIAQEFRCVRTGPFQILFYVRIQQPGTETLIFNGQNIRKAVTLTSGTEVRAMTGRCVQGESTPTPTPTASSTPSPTPTTAVADPTWEEILQGGEAVGSPLHSIVRGQVIVFVLDGVVFESSALQVTEAHAPFCSYVHVHGGPIRSIVPGADGQYVERSEHLGECGYGPPDFRIIRDPR